MSDETEFSELDRLLSQYLEGELSREELSTLEEIILADDRFADRFSRWCLMHRQVAELLSEDRLHELMDQFVTGSPGPPKSMLSPLVKAAQQNRTGASDTRSMQTWLRGDATECRRLLRPAMPDVLRAYRVHDDVLKESFPALRAPEPLAKRAKGGLDAFSDS